jgi:hypothetical protein
VILNNFRGFRLYAMYKSAEIKFRIPLYLRMTIPAEQLTSFQERPCAARLKLRQSIDTMSWKCFQNSGLKIHAVQATLGGAQLHASAALSPREELTVRVELICEPDPFQIRKVNVYPFSWVCTALNWVVFVTFRINILSPSSGSTFLQNVRSTSTRCKYQRA